MVIAIGHAIIGIILTSEYEYYNCIFIVKYVTTYDHCFVFGIDGLGVMCLGLPLIVKCRHKLTVISSRSSRSVTENNHQPRNRS